MMEFEEKLKAVAAPLLAWYDANRRRLPWREEVSPYRTWVSEIMLQQTRVAAVLPYFRRFMERYPTVEALAAGEEQELLKLWEGLGYYSRARNLQKTARIIAEEYGGRFPSEYKALTALPGIGDYTAGAIASIAFGEPVPAVDGNVLRVKGYIRAADGVRFVSDTGQGFETMESRDAPVPLMIICMQGTAGAVRAALHAAGIA